MPKKPEFRSTKQIVVMTLDTSGKEKKFPVNIEPETQFSNVTSGLIPEISNKSLLKRIFLKSKYILYWILSCFFGRSGV